MGYVVYLKSLFQRPIAFYSRHDSFPTSSCTSSTYFLFLHHYPAQVSHPNPAHLCMYAANAVAISADSLSCAINAIRPFCFASAAPTYSLTHLFTSVISGHWSRIGRLMVVSCVKPTPKLISSGSCSTIVSSVAAGNGGFSSNFSKASQVYAQPFLYFSAKALESAKVFAKEITAVFRSRGRKSFCVSGRMILRYRGTKRLDRASQRLEKLNH